MAMMDTSPKYDNISPLLEIDENIRMNQTTIKIITLLKLKNIILPNNLITEINNIINGDLMLANRNQEFYIR